MFDLGFEGPDFTWDGGNLKERIDTGCYAMLMENEASIDLFSTYLP